MDIFVYSDESGTFDCLRSRFFVFGGVVYLDSATMQSSSRRYQAIEKEIRHKNGLPESEELKAHDLDPKDSKRLFRATNREFRFGVVVEIPLLKIRNQIAKDKKGRQRYMDYVYKIAIKRFFISLIRDGAIDPSAVRTVHFYVDQHTTATDGIYELSQALEQELIKGTYNFAYPAFYPPLFPKARAVTLKYCDSKSVALVRAADVIANRIYRLAVSEKIQYTKNAQFFVIHQP